MQKLMLTICGLFVSVLLFTGCQTSIPRKSMEVNIENNGKFPQSLVGTWRAVEGEGWEFVFEPDGTISSAVISLGRIRIKPGQITRVEMLMGGEGIFEPGEWMVSYDPAIRQLIVKISLKHFRVEMGDSALEGKSTDMFIGTVSEDGKLWQVDWNGFPDYIAHTPEQPNFKMSEDPNYGLTKTMFFEKVVP